MTFPSNSGEPGEVRKRGQRRRQRPLDQLGRGGEGEDGGEFPGLRGHRGGGGRTGSSTCGEGMVVEDERLQPRCGSPDGLVGGKDGLVAHAAKQWRQCGAGEVV